jgi:capsule polysaccharide export protein KpsC/LpsZ
MSIGRNPIAMLRRLSRIPNVRLVDPHTSSLRLLSRAEGVVTISSTVGLEALLFERPVLTLGRPFYSGYGVTLDLDSPSRVDAAVPRLLTFEPDRERTRRFLHAAMRRCQPGAPVLVDRSDANARVLAASFARTAAESGAGVRA